MYFVFRGMGTLIIILKITSAPNLISLAQFFKDEWMHEEINIDVVSKLQNQLSNEFLLWGTLNREGKK